MNSEMGLSITCQYCGHNGDITFKKMLEKKHGHEIQCPRCKKIISVIVEICLDK